MQNIDFCDFRPLTFKLRPFYHVWVLGCQNINLYEHDFRSELTPDNEWTNISIRQLINPPVDALTLRFTVSTAERRGVATLSRGDDESPLLAGRVPGTGWPGGPGVAWLTAEKHPRCESRVPGIHTGRFIPTQTLLSYSLDVFALSL